jgi:hypothetical protein
MRWFGWLVSDRADHEPDEPAPALADLPRPRHPQVGENIRSYPMSLTSLECQVSKNSESVDIDARPRHPQLAARRRRAAARAAPRAGAVRARDTSDGRVRKSSC